MTIDITKYFKRINATIYVSGNRRDVVGTGTDLFTMDRETGLLVIKFMAQDKNGYYRPMNMDEVENIHIGLHFVGVNKSMHELEYHVLEEQGTIGLIMPNYQVNYEGEVIVHTYLFLKDGREFDGGDLELNFNHSWLDTQLPEMQKFYWQRIEDLIREMEDMITGPAEGITADILERLENEMNQIIQDMLEEKDLVSSEDFNEHVENEGIHTHVDDIKQMIQEAVEQGKIPTPEENEILEDKIRRIAEEIISNLDILDVLDIITEDEVRLIVDSAIASLKEELLISIEKLNENLTMHMGNPNIHTNVNDIQNMIDVAISAIEIPEGITEEMIRDVVLQEFDNIEFATQEDVSNTLAMAIEVFTQMLNTHINSESHIDSIERENWNGNIDATIAHIYDEDIHIKYQVVEGMIESAIESIEFPDSIDEVKALELISYAIKNIDFSDFATSIELNAMINMSIELFTQMIFAHQSNETHITMSERVAWNDNVEKTEIHIDDKEIHTHTSEIKGMIEQSAIEVKQNLASRIDSEVENLTVQIAELYNLSVEQVEDIIKNIILPIIDELPDAGLNYYEIMALITREIEAIPEVDLSHVNTHIDNNIIHITDIERAEWNARVTQNELKESISDLTTLEEAVALREEIQFLRQEVRKLNEELTLKATQTGLEAIHQRVQSNEARINMHDNKIANLSNN